MSIAATILNTLKVAVEPFFSTVVVDGPHPCASLCTLSLAVHVVFVVVVVVFAFVA